MTLGTKQENLDGSTYNILEPPDVNPVKTVLLD